MYQIGLFKVHLTPKYFFRSNKSLHLFETLWAFLPFFNPTIFHVNILVVLRRTARIIVLIKTIGLWKIRRTSYEKSFHLKFL